MSIIRRFSFVVPNLTMHSYNEYESVHTTTGKFEILSCFVIWAKVDDIAMAMSIPRDIAYSSEASTALVTLLHFCDI
jgi:hypothetical protein